MEFGEFEFHQRIEEPAPKNTYIVKWLHGAQSVFVEDDHDKRLYHGRVNGVSVLVDWGKSPKYTLYITLPNGDKQTHTGNAFQWFRIEARIQEIFADIFAVSGYERFRHRISYEYTAEPTGFILMYQDIYIITFTDGSGWFYATDDDPTDHYANVSNAFTPDIIPSAQHCIAAFIQGEFTYTGGNE